MDENDPDAHADPSVIQCRKTLRELIAHWPKRDRPEPADVRARLRHHLAKSFDEIDFLNPIDGVGEWGNAEAGSDEVTIQFADTTGYPQRAIFIRGPGQCWLLKSLAFLCPVCFGTGRNDGEVCFMCSGVGWGAS